MHIVNSCANDLQHTENKNKKQCQSSNYHLKKFFVRFTIVFPYFSDNFCRKRCLASSLLMWYSSYLLENEFPSPLTETTYFHMDLSISEFVIPLCCRYQVVLSCSSSKNIQFLAILPFTIQLLTPVVNL